MIRQVIRVDQLDIIYQMLRVMAWMRIKEVNYCTNYMCLRLLMLEGYMKIILVS